MFIEDIAEPVSNCGLSLPEEVVEGAPERTRSCRRLSELHHHQQPLSRHCLVVIADRRHYVRRTRASDVELGTKWYSATALFSDLEVACHLVETIYFCRCGIRRCCSER